MEIMQLMQSLIWLLAGVGVFIVGMNFMSDSLEKSAGGGMKKLLGKISNNRISGVGIGAGVTALIQSSSATSVMVIGLVNAGVMSLMQAAPIIMGANIGTTITGVLVALKNDYFNMLMYLCAFAGEMMLFSKKDKIKILGSLFCGLGLIFVGLNVMSSEEAFGNPLVEELFTNIFKAVDFPLLLILIGVIFTALIQSSSAATGVVITMVGTGVLPLELALFIVLGANIGTCVTALLASIGANENAKRVAFIHFIFNVIGTVFFSALIWIFKEPAVNLLVSVFPGQDPLSLQMRVSFFHVVFNVTTTLLLLAFTKPLVNLSRMVIKDKQKTEDSLTLKYVDDRLLTTPPIALMQVKKEMDHMFNLVEENMGAALVAMETGCLEKGDKIKENEMVIDFTNGALTKFLIRLSEGASHSDEQVIGSYFHVLNDLERIGDHAENFYEIGEEMKGKGIVFSENARRDISKMHEALLQMLTLSKEAFEEQHRERLAELTTLENRVDDMKREFSAKHYARLAEGNCNLLASPYYTSAIAGLERVADHLINVGFSIVSPIGSEAAYTKKENA